MKWLIGLAAIVALASLGVAAYIVLKDRDPVPADVRACVSKAGLDQARSSEALGAARIDANDGRLRVTRRWDWGRTSGVLLQGPRKDYAVLALWNDDTPSLARGDVGRRVFETPASFPAVVLELPESGRLVACAEKQ